MPDNETDNLRETFDETSPTEVDDPTLASVLRCDEASIRKYVRQGIIRRERNRKFELSASVGAVVEHLRQMAGRQATGDAMKAGAALKDAQRRLAEVKLAKLEGQLLSMPEIEAVWGDLVSTMKWLFLAFPARATAALPELTDAQVASLREICRLMLSEAAIQGEKPQLPAAKTILDADAEADE